MSGVQPQHQDGPNWGLGSDGTHRFQGKEHVDKSKADLELEPHEMRDRENRQETQETHQTPLEMLTSGPKPSRAKTIHGYFYRILNFLGLTKPRTNADLMQAIHSDRTLAGYYKIPGMVGGADGGGGGGDMLADAGSFLKKLKPSKAFDFVQHFAEDMRKKSPEEVSEDVISTLKEAKIWAKEVEKLRTDMTFRESSLDGLREKNRERTKGVQDKIEELTKNRDEAINLYSKDRGDANEKRLSLPVVITNCTNRIPQIDPEIAALRTNLAEQQELANQAKKEFDKSNNEINKIRSELKNLDVVEGEPKSSFFGKKQISQKDWDVLCQDVVKADTKNKANENTFNEIQSRIAEIKQNIANLQEEKKALQHTQSTSEKTLKNLKEDTYYGQKIETLKTECEKKVEVLRKEINVTIPQIETVEIEKRHQRINKIGSKMSQRIQDLKPEEKVVFSYSNDPNSLEWSLIQVIKHVSKDGKETYKLEVIGIPSDLAQFEADVLGKKKIERVAVYEGFEAEDLDQTFWTAALVGQIPKGPIDRIKEGLQRELNIEGRDLTLDTIIEAKGELAAKRAHDKAKTAAAEAGNAQVEIPRPPSPITRTNTAHGSVYAFGQVRTEGSTAMRTLKVFLKVNARTKEEDGQTSGLGSERAKIALGLSALREFYSTSYKSMATNHTERLLIEKAVENLRRQGDKSLYEGKITEADLQFLNTDLKEIETRLQALAQVETAKSPLHKSLPKKLMTYCFGKVDTHPFPKGIGTGAPPSVSSDYTPNHISSDALKAISVGTERKHFEGVEVQNIPAKLEALRKEAMKYYNEREYGKMTELVTEIFEQLPFGVEPNKATQELLKGIPSNVFDLAYEIKKTEQNSPDIWTKAEAVVKRPGLTNLVLERMKKQNQSIQGLSDEDKNKFFEALNLTQGLKDVGQFANLNDKQLKVYSKMLAQKASAGGSYTYSGSEIYLLSHPPAGYDDLSPEEQTQLRTIFRNNYNRIQDFDLDKIAQLKAFPFSVISLFESMDPYTKEDIEHIKALAQLDYETFGIVEQILKANLKPLPLDQITSLLRQDAAWFLSAQVTSPWATLSKEAKETTSREISRFQQILTEGTLKTQLAPERELLLLKTALLQDHLLRITSPDYAPLAPQQLKKAVEGLKAQADPEHISHSDLYQNREWRALASQLISYADKCGLSTKEDLHNPTGRNRAFYSSLFKPNDSFKGSYAELETKKVQASNKVDAIEKQIASLQKSITDKEIEILGPLRRAKGELTREKTEKESEIQVEERILKYSLAQIKHFTKKLNDLGDPKKEGYDKAKANKYENKNRDFNKEIKKAEAKIAQLKPELSAAKTAVDNHEPKITQASKELKVQTDRINAEIKGVQKELKAAKEASKKASNTFNSLKECSEVLAKGMNSEYTFKKGDTPEEWSKKVGASMSATYTVKLSPQIADLRVAEFLLDSKRGLGGLDNNILKWYSSMYSGQNFNAKELNKNGEYNFSQINRDNSGRFRGELGKYGHIDRVRSYAKAQTKNNHRWGWAWSPPSQSLLSEPSAAYSTFDKTLAAGSREVMNEFQIVTSDPNSLLYRLELYNDRELSKLANRNPEGFIAFFRAFNQVESLPHDLMRALSDHPSLISNPSIRTILESKLLQRSLIKHHIQDNPDFFNNMKGWIAEKLAASPMDMKPDTFAAYLRMGVLFQDIVEDLQKEAYVNGKSLENVSDKEISELPFKKTLGNILNAQEKMTQEFIRFTGNLWSLHLQQYTTQKTFNGQELIEIAKGMVATQNNSQDPQGVHRWMNKKCENLYQRIKPDLQKHIKENEGFRNLLLDQIAVTVNGKRGDGEWKGSWPRFQNGSYHIDLNKGVLNKKGAGGELKDFPEELIPQFDPNDVGVKLGIIREWGLPKSAELSSGKENEQVYQFSPTSLKDTTFYLINNLSKGEQHLYREFTHHKKTNRYELVSDNALLIQRNGGEKSGIEKALDWGQETFGLPIDGMIKEAILTYFDGVKHENGIPSFMSEQGMSFWKNPESPGDVLVVNAEGEALYRVTFNRKGQVETFEDLSLKLETPRIETVHSAIGAKHPVLNQIARFEESKHIELYGHEGNLERIFLPRFGLNFEFKEGKWFCKGPDGSRLNNDFYLVERPTLDQQRGLRHVLVLEDGKGKEVFINPQLITPAVRISLEGIRDPSEFSNMMEKIQQQGIDFLTKQFGPQTLVPKLETYLPDIVKGAIKGLVYRLLFEKEKATLKATEPLNELLNIQLKHPDGDQQLFEVFEKDSSTGVINHVGGNSPSKTDNNTAFFELMQQAIISRQPLHAVTFLKRIEGTPSPDIVLKLAGMTMLLDFAGFLFSPNERVVVLKAFLELKNLIPHINRLQNLAASEAGGQDDLPAKMLYEQLLKHYSSYLTQHNQIHSELQLTAEEHRFLLSIANTISPQFARQHGNMIKDLIRQEEIKKANVNKLAEQLAKIGQIDNPSALLEKTSKQFLDLIISQPAEGVDRQAQWSETREKLQKAALIAQGEEKDYFTTLDRFAEYAMESTGGVDELFQQDETRSLPTFEEVRRKKNIDLSKTKNATPEEKEKELRKNLETYFKILIETAQERKLTPVTAVKIVNRSISNDLSEAKLNAEMFANLQQLFDFKSFCPDAKTLVDAIETNTALRQEKGEVFSVKKPPADYNVEYKALSTLESRYFGMEKAKDLEHTEEMLVRLASIENNLEESSSVRKAAEELRESLEKASESHTQTQIPKLKDDKIADLRNVLNRKKEDYHNNAELHKKEIEALLIPPGLSDREKQLLLEKKGPGAVELEDVMKAFLQDDLSTLKMKLHPGTNFDALREAVHAYLLDATMEQRADRCLNSLNDYVKAKKEDPEDQSGVATAACFALHTDLLGERQYDPAIHPDFMIFELKANILIRPNQLPVLEALVKDPNSVKQAVTGIGKTSVILLLVALLKAQPGQLSMLYFPRELFEDNTQQLQLKLGSFFERNVYELRYPPSNEQLKALGLPAEQLLERPWELDPKMKAGYEFIMLYNMYDQLIKTTTDRGVITSTKEAALGLQSQYKTLLKKLSAIEDVDDIKGNEELLIEAVTAVQLSKILLFLRKNGVQLTDEVDRICDVRDKFLRASHSDATIAEFKSNAILEVYDALFEVEAEAELKDKTYVLENGQQDIKPEVRQRAIEKTAQKLSEKLRAQGFEARGDVFLGLLLSGQEARKELENSREFKALSPADQKNILSQNPQDKDEFVFTDEFQSWPKTTQEKVFVYLNKQSESVTQSEEFQSWSPEIQSRIFAFRAMIGSKPEAEREHFAKILATNLKEQIGEEGYISEKDIVLDYILGKPDSDSALIHSEDFAKWPPQMKDHLKILQEEISGNILKGALSSKEGLKYGGYTDGEKHPSKAHEVVPYRLGQARNNSSHGLETERVTYTTQYYYQKGPSEALTENWLNIFVEEANKELQFFKSNGIDEPPFSELKSAEKFKSFFAREGETQNDFLLEKYIGEDSLKKFMNDLNTLPKNDEKRLCFIKNFLKTEVLIKLKASPPSTQDDSSGFLSMHSKNSGASATIGGLMGIKALNTEGAEDPEALGKMMLFFLENGNFICKEYDPHDEENLGEVLTQQTANEVFIDGAGLFAGTSGEEQAFALLNRLNGTNDAPGPHPEIKGIVFWNQEGLNRVVIKDERGNPKVMSVKDSGLKKHQLGMYCDYARSRGADQPLGTRAIGSVTVNEMMDLDGLAQAKGRMRGEAQGQGTEAWVPSGSGMKNKVDVVESATRKKAELVEENLCRRTIAEMRNQVHEGMMDRLLMLTSGLVEGEDFDFKDMETKAPAIFARLGLLKFLTKEYAKYDILGLEGDKPLQPGEYWENNKMLTREVDTPIALEEARQRYLKIANNCHLSGEFLQWGVFNTILMFKDNPMIREQVKGTMMEPILDLDFNDMDNWPDDTFTPFVKDARNAVKTALGIEEEEEVPPPEAGFFAGFLQNAAEVVTDPGKAAKKLLSAAIDGFISEETFHFLVTTTLESALGIESKQKKRDFGAQAKELFMKPLKKYIQDQLFHKGLNENLNLFDPATLEKAASLLNVPEKLEQVAEEWKTDTWKETILVRMPKKYKTGAEGSDQAQELEAQEEREEQVEQEQEQEALQLRTELNEMAPLAHVSGWNDWDYHPTHKDHMQTLINASIPGKWISRDLSQVGDRSLKSFFEDIHVTTNVTDSNDIFPKKHSFAVSPKKPVDAVLVTRDDNGIVHVLGLDALDRNRALEILSESRKEKLEDGDIRQAYVYDLGRDKVISRGRNREGIPTEGTPPEILNAVLKFKLYNLQLNYKLAELDAMEKLLRDRFMPPDNDPTDFIKFKTYFEESMLRLRHKAHIHYEVGNFKGLMEKLEKEAQALIDTRNAEMAP